MPRAARITVPRTIIYLSIATLTGAMLAIVVAYFFNDAVIEKQMRNNAMLISRVVHESRRLYSDEVVARLRPLNDVQISNRYTDFSHGIPNPATFTILLGQRLSDGETRIHMYSDLPFKNRKGGPVDAFGKAALEKTVSDPTVPHVSVENRNDIRLLRFAGAMVMEQSCVNCHVAHPDSPKRDWKVGDVRGVLEVTQPFVSHGSVFKQVHLTRLALVSVAVLLAVGGVLLVLRLRSTFAGLEHDVTVRTAKLEEHATTDALTGLSNRRAFDERLGREWEISARYGQKLSLLFIDVDHFKSYNDHYGHPAGDDCLRRVSRAMQEQLRRDNDVVARYGGEEFAVILPGIGHTEAQQVSEKLRAAIDGLQIAHEGIGNSATISVSIGYCSVHKSHAKSVDEFIEAADKSLYRAKELGRNRVESLA